MLNAQESRTSPQFKLAIHAVGHGTNLPGELLCRLDTPSLSICRRVLGHEQDAEDAFLLRVTAVDQPRGHRAMRRLDAATLSDLQAGVLADKGSRDKPLLVTYRIES